MSRLAQRLAGKFIVLDGPDGSGKSSQLARLKEHLAGLGAAVEVVYDPGGTEAGEKIRALLLGRETARLAPMTETLLFMASRAQLVAEKIKPALKAGRVVLCDRFISATLAYQGASGVDANVILDLGEAAVQGYWPDLTILLDVPVEVGMQRKGAPRQALPKARGGAEPSLALFGDRMEARDETFHQKVRQNFRQLPKTYPHPAVCLRGDRPPDEVFADLLAALEKTFGEAGA